MASVLQLLSRYNNHMARALTKSRCCTQSTKRQLTDSMRKKMEHFQREDGTPIYLKGGPFDKILFIFTTVLCVIGVGDGVVSMLSLGKKK